ncbi:hypothetical protein LTR95_018091 [Oleoguttula sp. CCFEE 5521]
MAAPVTVKQRKVVVETTEEVIQIRLVMSELVTHYEEILSEPPYHRGIWLVAFLMLEEPPATNRQYTPTRSLALSDLVERVTRIRFYRQQLVKSAFSAGSHSHDSSRDMWAEVFRDYDLPIVTRYPTATTGDRGYCRTVTGPIYSVSVASAMAYLRIHMPSTASATSFNILGRPAELRIEIYHRVFPYPATGVCFEREHGWGNTRTRRQGFVLDDTVILNRGNTRNISLFDVFPTALRKYDTNPATASIGWYDKITALLRVSKLIYQEAMPVFFHNHYVFSRMDQLGAFLTKATRSIVPIPTLSTHALSTATEKHRSEPWTPPLHHPKRLSISYEYVDHEDGGMLSLLSGAVGLKTLRIHLDEPA